MSNTKNQGNHGNSQQHAEAGRKGGQHSHEATSQQTHNSSQSDARHQDNLSPEKRREIGRKGGEAVSSDREHMSEIGKKGGQS